MRSQEQTPEGAMHSCPSCGKTAPQEYTALSTDLCRYQKTGDEYAMYRFATRAEPIQRGYLSQKFKNCPRLSIDQAVQDALIRIHERIHTYRCSPDALPWVKTITRYAAYDQLRVLARRDKIGKQLIVKAGDDGGELARYEPAASPDDQPENAARQNEYMQRIDLAVANLTALERDILQMRRESIPFEQIALVMEMSPSTVWTIATRLMKLLKDLQ